MRLRACHRVWLRYTLVGVCVLACVFTYHQPPLPLNYQAQVEAAVEDVGSISEDVGSMSVLSRHRQLLQNLESSIDESLNDESEMITALKSTIGQINSQQAVLNEELFGPVTNETLVFVVQVHTRLENLRDLVNSIMSMKIDDGNDLLIIFSLDVWDNQLIDYINSINFVRVMLIMFPWSIQAHPREFPGTSPTDCNRDFKKTKKPGKVCEGDPDTFGHYRECKFTQIKHHWWWKANFVFNQLHILKHYQGHVFFVEEDLYISKDFTHVYKLLKDVDSKAIYSFGMFTSNNVNYRRAGNKVSYVRAAPVNMALKREHWQTIVKCSPQFCQFDDYNWDLSLAHVFHMCPATKSLKTLILNGPRILHNGDCSGIHKSQHQRKTCSSPILPDLNNNLFPNRLEIKGAITSLGMPKRNGYGGWGDKRDHTLCLNIAGLS